MLEDPLRSSTQTERPGKIDEDKRIRLDDSKIEGKDVITLESEFRLLDQPARHPTRIHQRRILESLQPTIITRFTPIPRLTTSTGTISQGTLDGAYCVVPHNLRNTKL